MPPGHYQQSTDQKSPGTPGTGWKCYLAEFLPHNLRETDAVVPHTGGDGKVL